MRKILVSTILGVGIAGTANASIVSSGFLDEKLTEYALSTSLDLKANQTDLTALSNKIGTLPDGLTVANLYNGWTISNGEYINGLSIIAYADFTTYDPLADELRSGRKTESGGYLNVLARLLFDDGYYQAENSVLAPFWYLTKQALRVGEIPHGKTVAGMIDEINTKIGTLPSGNLLGFPESESLFSWSAQPYTYPTSLAELINAIYGNSKTGQIGFLAGIVTGFPLYRDGYDIIEGRAGLIPNFELARDANYLANANATKIGTVPDGKNLAGMISETDAKIGTLPAGYDSIGAALTAIKGIAEDAKAAALAAIPDPKQEGSSGKFVLTVDIVGDNATYRWEKIDREGETTTTTE